MWAPAINTIYYMLSGTNVLVSLRKEGVKKEGRGEGGGRERGKGREGEEEREEG